MPFGGRRRPAGTGRSRAHKGLLADLARVHRVEFAFEQASLHRADVLAVHVRDPHPGSVETSASDAGEIEEGQRLLKGTLAGWHEKYPDVTARREVALGHPVHILVQASEQATCLVVGTRGLGGFRGMLLGSVGYGVLHHAHCPVVVLPRTP